MTAAFTDAIASESFLEYAFLRWVLTPAATGAVVNRVHAQAPVSVEGHNYRLDYEIAALNTSSPSSSTDTRSTAAAARSPTTGCARTTSPPPAGSSSASPTTPSAPTPPAASPNCRPLLRTDPLLAALVVELTRSSRHRQMDPDPLHALSPSPRRRRAATDDRSTYFDDRPRQARPAARCASARRQAFAALANYYLPAAREPPA